MKAHLVKGSAAAKAFMAKLRSKKTKVGAVKKKAALKKSAMHKDTKSHNVNIRVVSGLSKAKKLQKKLKSEGMKLTKGYDLQKRKRIGSIDYEIQLTRVNNDLNGNPRYVVHFLNFLNDEENTFLPFNKKYDYALLKAKKIGGKKFHNKQYGGGIVFQSYNTDILKKNIIDLKHTTPQIKY